MPTGATQLLQSPDRLRYENDRSEFVFCGASGMTGEHDPDEAAPAGFVAVPSPFIGRERELHQLRAAFTDAAAGRGRLVFLVGEPGIGKTRLAEELARHAGAHDAQVLWGRCWEGSGAPAYWPWVRAIRSYTRRCDPHALPTELGLGAPYIAQLVPDLRVLLPDLPEPPAALLPESEDIRFRVFDAVTTFLRNVASRRPLLLVLDDVHTADLPSLLLLQFLAQELRDCPLLVIATYRDAEVRTAPQRAAILGQLGRDATTIPLRGFSEVEVGQFVQAAAGYAASPNIVETLYRSTAGNPFFVDEVVRLLNAEGDLQPTGKAAPRVRVPENVRAAIRQRLGHLSRAANEVLTIAAVVGREFEVRVLEHVTSSLETASGSERPTPVASVADAMAEALAAGIILDAPATPSRFVFSHVLVRDTLYEDVPPALRAQLHGLIGDGIEQLYGATADAHLAAIANHFRLAVPPGDIDRALHHTWLAAEQALCTYAYEEAVTQYDHALQLANAGAAEDGSRCELLLGLGTAQTRAVDTEGAKRTFRRAAELAQQLGTPQMLARAALGVAGVGIGLPFGETDPTLVHLLEQALDRLGGADSALHVRLLGRLAVELYYTDGGVRRAELSAAAVDMARRLGDPSGVAYALGSMHYALWGPDNTDARLAIATEMVGLAEQAGDSELTLQGRTCRVIDLLELGDGAALDREIAAFARLASDLRQPRYLWMATHFRAVRALSRGDFEAAERLAGEAFGHSRRSHDPGADSVFGGHLFGLRCAQGRLVDFEAPLKAYLDQFPTIVSARAGLAYLYSEVGRAAAARNEFETLAVNDFADLPVNYSWLIALACLANTCAFLEDTVRAKRLYDLLLPYADRAACVGHPATYYHGSVSYCLGLLAATVSRWELAAQHFERGLKMDARMGSRPYAARAQYAYARMLLARCTSGDPEAPVGKLRDAAARLVSDALATARELGIEALVDPLLALQSTAEGLAAQDASKGLSGAETHTFRKDGDYWTITYAGDTRQLKDSRGLQYLAHLLRHPGREFHANELVALVAGLPPDDGRRAADVAAQAGGATTLARDLGDAGTRLDAQATAEYRHRLSDLREEIQEADTFNDSGRAAALRAEIDSITASSPQGAQGSAPHRTPSAPA
jgi:tetratricopeptide (TPR) repeat protein